MDSGKFNIVITGAPSSGKSTTLTALTGILGKEAITVPESARVLLSGGFPAPAHDDMKQIRAFQKAILRIQTSLEIVFNQQHPSAKILIFDRGRLDGASFWPEGPDNFLDEFKVDVKKEFEKYQAVIFFELPEQDSFGGVNQLRFHNYEQCVESEKILKQLWSKHPNFVEIKATRVFEDKITTAITIIKKIINNLLNSTQ